MDAVAYARVVDKVFGEMSEEPSVADRRAEVARLIRGMLRALGAEGHSPGRTQAIQRVTLSENDARGNAAEPAAVRVLLVSSNVVRELDRGGWPIGTLVHRDARGCETAVVPYDYDATRSYVDLIELIRAFVGRAGLGHTRTPSRLLSVGLMFHTEQERTLKCFARDPLKSTVYASDESLEPFRQFVHVLRAFYGVEDVDLISCSVVENAENVLARLDYGGARVNASMDVTGQAGGSVRSSKGDWVLEMGNVDLVGRYFNARIAQTSLMLLFGLNLRTTATSPEDALVDIGYQVYNQVPAVRLIVDALVGVSQAMFAGKSFLEILCVFTDVIGFIPGPIGFVAGLAGAALSIAIYAEKVKSGTATGLDHLDLVMGCVGCMMSVVPGARAAAKMAAHSAKIASKSVKTKIVTMTIRLADNIAGGTERCRKVAQTVPEFKVGHLRAVKQAMGHARGALKQTIDASLGRAEKAAKLVDMHGQFTAIENILSVIPTSADDGEDATDKWTLSRQALIDAVCSLQRSAKEVDDVGVRREADFSALLVMQYGTATIYRGDDEVFIDNATEREPYRVTSAVTRIKVNPYTKLSINRQVWENESTTEVRVVDVNLPVDNYAVFAIGYDGGVWGGDPHPGTLVVETVRDSQYSIAIGENSRGAAAEDPRIDDALVNDRAQAIYGHASLRVPTADIKTVRIGPNTTVVVSRKPPRETKAVDVVCAWANKTNAEMVITNIRELAAVPNRGSPVVHMNVSVMSSTPYAYGSYVRLMFQDATPRSLAVAELLVRYSGYHIEGGVLKFDRAQHNRAAVAGAASAKSSSGDARRVVDKNVASEFESNTEIMPWVEVPVGSESSDRYIDNVHVIFSGDAAKREWLRGASIGIFDRWHYLVDSTPVWSDSDSNDVVANTRELDYPRYKGLRFNLMYLQVESSGGGVRRPDLIAWVQVENVQGAGFNCFTRPAISLIPEQRADIMRAGAAGATGNIQFVNTGNYYAEVPDYLGMPILYRYIKLWTREPLGRSKIDLYMYTQKTNPNGFLRPSSGVRGPTYVSVFKKSVALPSAVDSMLFGTNYKYYCVDLYAT